MKVVFTKKLTEDQTHEMVAIIRSITFQNICHPIRYPKLQTLRHTKV